MGWKFSHEGNCRGLPSDAEQLSWVTEFSFCTKQPLWIFFLTYSSLHTLPLTNACRNICRKMTWKTDIILSKKTSWHHTRESSYTPLIWPGQSCGNSRRVCKKQFSYFADQSQDTISQWRRKLAWVPGCWNNWSKWSLTSPTLTLSFVIIMKVCINPFYAECGIWSGSTMITYRNFYLK